MSKDSKIFVVSALVWEVVIAILYGLFIRYNTTAFTNMQRQIFEYPFADDNPTFKYYTANGTQAPFPFMVVLLGMALLIVGLALVAGYVERSSITNIALTLLLFALAVQNFFIFRDFFDRGAVNNPNGTRDYSTRYYQKINSINFGNQLPASFDYTSASFVDAVGAALALYTGFTAVMGRVGFGGIFFLAFFGTFFYQLNETILWRLFIPDNGFASRAFAYGGVLGVVSSLILGQREHTAGNLNFVSTYSMRSMPLLGVILVWCTFPVLVTVNTYNKVNGEVVAMIGQVNIWLALAGSAIGTYLASIFLYRKFSVGDLVFAVVSGGIAYSSSTDINYNPGAALTIGSVVGFTCATCQNRVRRYINKAGVLDSNGVIFNFLLPSFFAAATSAILSGIDQTTANTTIASGGSLATSASFGPNAASGRSATTQGGYQLIGWLISICFGAISGGIVGLLYKLCDSRDRAGQFFSDFFLYEVPKVTMAPKNSFESQIHTTNQALAQPQSSFPTDK